MGKKKRSTGTKKKKIKKNALSQAIIIIIISILLAIFIYGQSGTLGKGLSTMLGGLMGWIKYTIPIGTFIVGIILTKEQKEFVIPKIVQFVIIILCICGTLGLTQISSKELSIDDDYGAIISEAYNRGEINKGGGAIGAIIAVPMTKTIGVASYVVLIGAAVLLSIFTFGMKPAELVDKVSEKVQNSKRYNEEDYEDEEDEEEEKIERRPPKRKKEKIQKRHSVIMQDLFDDEEETEKKRYDHDIPLAFDEQEQEPEPEVKPSKKEKIKEKEKEKQKEKAEDEYIEANLFKEKKEEKEERTKQELQLEHSQVEIDENYEFPPIALLEQGEGRKPIGKTAITDNALKLQKTLHSFGVSAKVEDVSVGPAITRYELKPAEGVRVSKIANLADDIALNLAAQSIRIEAPIPRKTSSRN